MKLKYLIWILVLILFSSVVVALESRHGAVSIDFASTVGCGGAVMNTTSNATISAIQKYAGDGTTRCFLYDGVHISTDTCTGSPLATGTFVGDNCSLNASVTRLVTDGNFTISVDGGGVAKNHRYSATLAFPVLGNNSVFNYNIGTWDSTFSTRAQDILGVTYEIFAPPPVGSPTNSTWNVTSGVVSGQNSSSWNTAGLNQINITGDNLSITVVTNVVSNASADVDVERNYTENVANNSLTKFATTNVTNHAGTYYGNLSAGNHCLYVSFINNANGVDTDSGVSSSRCLNFTAVDNITITINFITPLNSSGDDVSSFNTSNLEEIETMELNFTVRSPFTNLTDWSLNFTANGTSGCSLGNKQDSVCYNFTNSNASRKWIEFINGSQTDTFDGTEFGRATGDGITPTISKSADGREWNVSLTIDEHYNPNVLKHYSALYNFSDVKFQNGVNQRITGNTIIEIHLGHPLIPLNGDQYKLDIRVNTSSTLPNQPIESHLCNSTYKLISGNPVGNPACALVVQKLQSEFQDDGTKHRGIFTKQLVDELGDILFLLLRTDENNPNRYYFIKTYKATAAGYNTHWNFSNDNGATFSNLGDGYETEANINWFIDGNDPTAFIGNIYANNTAATSNSELFNQTWDIDPTQKYNPMIELITPTVNQTILCPFNVTFKADDPNDDNLNISIFLFNGTTLNQTIKTDMNQSNTSFNWNCSDVIGNVFNLTIEAKKIGNESFNSSDTHEIIINEAPVVTLNFPVDKRIENDTNQIVFNATATDNSGLFNISLFITNSTNGSFSRDQNKSITGTTNTTTFTKQLTSGNYTWGMEVCDNQRSCSFSQNRSLEVTFDCLNSTLTSGTLAYPVNYSILNWSDILNSSVLASGNYSWNFTELNVEPTNITGSLYILQNTCDINITINLSQSTTRANYNWFCLGINITNTPTNIINITNQSTEFMNCTLDVLNISQTYVNWNLTNNTAIWDIDPVFIFV